MTNQLLMIAALPSGGGCMASLPPEKAEPPLQFINRQAFELPNWGQRPSLLMSAKLGALGYCVKDGVIERLPEKAEKSWGAFEPFDYCERN